MKLGVRKAVARGPSPVASEGPSYFFDFARGRLWGAVPTSRKAGEKEVPRSNLSLGQPKNYFSTRMNSPEEALTATVNLAASRLEP